MSRWKWNFGAEEYREGSSSPWRAVQDSGEVTPEHPAVAAILLLTGMSRLVCWLRGHRWSWYVIDRYVCGRCWSVGAGGQPTPDWPRHAPLRGRA